MKSRTWRWRAVSGFWVGCGAGWSGTESTLTRSCVRGKHPFDISLDTEQAFGQRSCHTHLVRSTRRVHPGPAHELQEPIRWPQSSRSNPVTSKTGPRGRRPAPAPPLATRLVLVESPCRLPRPRPARRHQRAVYRRRRVIAALVGLGLVLAVARAGAALGGSSLATSERLPHVQQVVVQPGDTMW